MLITGACGQIGSELTLALREKYRHSQVIATDLREPTEDLKDSGPFEQLDVMDEARLNQLIEQYKVTQVYHLAAMLSATAEKHPLKAWALNMDSILYVLEAAARHKLHKVFWPSSIAAFGPNSPKAKTPQHTVMDPTSVYGISKLAGEGWCNYYFQKKGVDVRSVRYPGLISYKTPPGGGTTDYAIDIFIQAVQSGSYTSFLEADAALPMMYMPDAIRGTLELMEAPAEKLTVRTSYNLAGLTFTPAELANAIQEHMPDFTIEYKPDYRQAIAASWPNSIDDSVAQADWGWAPEFDLSAMTQDMLKNIEQMLAQNA